MYFFGVFSNVAIILKKMVCLNRDQLLRFVLSVLSIMILLLCAALLIRKFYKNITKFNIWLCHGPQYLSDESTVIYHHSTADVIV